MKYRIVETKQGFIIQRKLFNIIWIECSEAFYSYDNYIGGYTRKDNVVWVHEFLSDAKKALERIKTFPIYYNGHKITYGIWNDTVTYIDLDSLRFHSIELFYRLGSNSLDYLKMMIDELERKKEFNKDKNTIIKIYYGDEKGSLRFGK